MTERFLVVVSYYDARDRGPLLALLDRLSELPAGAPHDVRVVVNQTNPEPLELPPRHASVEVLHRENEGFNLGAWDAGWRTDPAYAGYLFLQDDCQLLRPGWLAAFARRAAEPDVGLVGERLSPVWDAPWRKLEQRFAGHRLPGHTLDGEPADRLDVYRAFFARAGIDPGPRGDHLQTLALFARREVLEATGGFPLGRDYGEAIAAEIGFSKRVQAAGKRIVEVGRRPFTYVSHPQWTGRRERARPLVLQGLRALPPADPDTVRVFVGADRTQLAGVWALEHSLRRNASLPVEVYPMVDLPVPVPADPRQRQRTGFSFSRFCIPQLTGYRGRAIYLDADMLVLGDIAELWRWPMGEARIVIQRELDEQQARTHATVGAPTKRIRQCAVMLLDCERLDWDVTRIVAGLDRGDYDYEQLLYELCLLEDRDIGCVLPFSWNSLEKLEPDTRLIHYTDMATQPWVSNRNPNDGVWLAELREAILDGSVTWADLAEEARLGHVRPSLLADLRYGHRVPPLLDPVRRRIAESVDRARGFRMHQAVYAAKRERSRAIEEHDRQRLAEVP